jgi:hypothetical protein
MKKPATIALVVAVALTAINPTRADVLELKNGTILNGKYVGGTEATVRFEALGSIQVLPTSEIIALTFTSTGSAPAAPASAPPPSQPTASATPPPAPAPAAVAKNVALPTGTLLLVRTKDSISSKNKAGTPFSTKLEYDLFVDGTKVVPAGAVIYGKVLSSTQARRARGQSTLDLRLTQIAIGETPVTIATTGFKQAGEKSIKDAARGAAAGAAIGAIADGGDGAATGAAIGATAGALKKGQSITVPPGTLIEFNLTQPCTITVAAAQ